MGRALHITVSQRQRAILSKWVRAKAETPYRLVERSRIILMSAGGVTNIDQAHRLDVDRQRVRRWRGRWAQAEERLAAAERDGASEQDLGALIGSVLTDEQRSGVTPTFSAEQLTQIIAVACEPPEAKPLSRTLATAFGWSSRRGMRPGSIRSRSGSAFSFAAP